MARGPIDVDAVDACGDARGVAGADRFTIARHLRRAFGTSPDRYRMLRPLGLARAIGSAEPLARAVAEAGFAEQSHMTHQFRRAYGLTPASWSRAVSAGLSPAPRRPPA